MFLGKNFKNSINKLMVEIKPWSIKWLNFLEGDLKKFGYSSKNLVANFLSPGLATKSDQKILAT
jgi:hypothetical protein